MKRIILNLKFLALLTFLAFSCKKESSQSTVTETANVTTPGTLYIVAKAYLYTVTNLTVTGNIDARDFKTMRDSMSSLKVLDLNNANIAAYTGRAGTWFTNSEIVTYLAYTIPQMAFYGSNNIAVGKSLTSVTLPWNITAIGDDAFYLCSALTGSLNIPLSVTYIGYEAFSGCGFTGSLTIPSSVTLIKDGAFLYCTGLTSIVTLNPVPLSGNSMGGGIFAGDNNVSTLYVPSGSVNAYQAALGWNGYGFNIVAY